MSTNAPWYCFCGRDFLIYSQLCYHYYVSHCEGVYCCEKCLSNHSDFIVTYNRLDPLVLHLKTLHGIDSTFEAFYDLYGLTL